MLLYYIICNILYYIMYYVILCIILYYVLNCIIVLYYIILYYIILYYILYIIYYILFFLYYIFVFIILYYILYFIILYCIICYITLYYMISYYIIYYIIYYVLLYYIILFYFILFYILFYYIILYYNYIYYIILYYILYHIVLYYIILYYIILYYITLYYIILYIYYIILYIYIITSSHLLPPRAFLRAQLIPIPHFPPPGARRKLGAPKSTSTRGASCSHQGWRAWQWHSEPSSSARIRCKCTSGAARAPGAPRILKPLKRLKFNTSSAGFGCSICLVVAVTVVIYFENGPNIFLQYRAEVFRANLILLPPHHSRMPKYLWTPGTPQIFKNAASFSNPNPQPRRKKNIFYHIFPQRPTFKKIVSAIPQSPAIYIYILVPCLRNAC